MPHVDQRRNQLPDPVRKVIVRVSWISWLVMTVSFICVLGPQVPQMLAKIFH